MIFRCVRVWNLAATYTDLIPLSMYVRNVVFSLALSWLHVEVSAVLSSLSHKHLHSVIIEYVDTNFAACAPASDLVHFLHMVLSRDEELSA